MSSSAVVSRTASAVQLALSVSLVAGSLFVACGQETVPSASPSLLAVATETRSPSPSLPDLPAEELAKAVQFRESLGLNANETYIRTVAADPASQQGVSEFGVPLTAPELDDLHARQSQSDRVVPVVVAYGSQHGDDFAGVYIDQERGGIVVARFVADLVSHERALRTLVGPDVLLDVKGAEFSKDQLDAHMQSVSADLTWLASIPARRKALGVDISIDRLVMEVSSPHPDAVALIAAHLGNPAWLVVVSDGTGNALLKAGTLVVEVLGESGRPLAGLSCVFIPDWNKGPEDPFDGQWETDALGRCSVELQATGYWVRIEEVRDARIDVLAIERVMVSPSRITKVTIRLSS